MIPLISPALQRSPMPARHLRVLLTIFAVRHFLGIGAFVWLSWTAHAAELPLWWVLPAFGLLYGGAVVWNGRKLLHQYRRRLNAERATVSGRNPVPPSKAG